MAKKGKPGPKAEVFKVNLPFEEAVKAALKTKPPPKERKKQSKKK